ncbi:oxidoreductase [Natronoglycomyces albus]|uniref:Oxidoreductase n=1 Tax=Natronoglycomyces albus TaxID=2811108 RepID=A0A895XQ97_9ACTN|nr:oxidoreductase [Natronoglycomyces albus]
MVPNVDPLSPLLELSEVADAMENARAAVDRMLWHKTMRNHAAEVASEVAVRNTIATLNLEGIECDPEALEAGAVDDPTVQGVLRISTTLPSLVDLWGASPRYVLAKLHLMAARDVGDNGEVGRPVLDEVGQARMDALCALITSPTKEIPAGLQAAVVHGELLALRPFATMNDIVARAAARLVLANRGLDPRLLIATDWGHWERQPEYVGAQKAFATGSPDGVRSWLKHYGQAVETGAGETLRICNEIGG